MERSGQCDLLLLFSLRLKFLKWLLLVSREPVQVWSLTLYRALQTKVGTRDDPLLSGTFQTQGLSLTFLSGVGLTCPAQGHREAWTLCL